MLEEGDYFVTTDEPHPEYGQLFKVGGPWKVISCRGDEIIAWPARDSGLTGELVMKESEVKEHIQTGRIAPIEHEEPEEEYEYDEVIHIQHGDETTPVGISQETFDGMREAIYEDETDYSAWLQDAVKIHVSSGVDEMEDSMPEAIRAAIKEKLGMYNQE